MSEYERKIEVTFAAFVNSPDGNWAINEQKKQRIADVLGAKDPIATARAVGALDVIEYFLSFQGG